MLKRASVRLALASALVVAGLTASSAQNRTAPPGIPSLQFEKYTLPNGLDVILSRDTRLPLVAVNLWYHVGPANEEPGRTGFAHLFEHMMFQSSKHVPPDAHFRLLEGAGATGINGTTGFDRTNYFETVPSNQLALALWLESDRMGYLLDQVDQAALSNQQDVVRNERRQTTENRPYGIVEEALVQMIYPAGHPYHGNVIGSHADIQAAKLEDVQGFFKRYYAPNNASLAIVGDFDPADAKKLVEKYFGTLKRGAQVPPIKATTPPIPEERRRIVHDRVELPRVYMAWLTPPIYKPGDEQADVLGGILGDGRSSRLYKKLVYEKQIAQDVNAAQQSLTLGSIFEITATARPGHTAEELEKAIDEELQTLRSTGPEAREVERALNTFETQIVSSLESFRAVANRLNSYNHYLGTPEFLQKDIERYRAVTPQTIHQFVREYLQPSRRVVVHGVPGEPDFGAPTPTPAPSASQSAGGGESINADEPWRNEVPSAAAGGRLLEVPSPASMQLANGLTLILSERRGIPMVAADLVVRTGSDANPPDAPGLANFSVAMLDEGTSSRNALQIADELAQIGATLGINSSMDASNVNTRALKQHFPAALDLLADVVQRPSFPAEEIERQRASRLAQLAQQRENPAQLAAKALANVLYGDRHPYGFTELGTEASVKSMSRDAMVAFWKQNFVPNNAALVVAGDISMAELQALAEKAFGQWQRGTPAQPALGSPATTEARVVIVDRPGAPQTQVRVTSIGVPRSSPDFRAIQVMNTALGGLFSSRINMNLREEHGYTYGANSQFQFRRGAGPFVIGSAVRTDVTAPAVTEIFKEVRAMTAEPMTAEELKKAKDALANSLPGAFETNANVAASYANVYIYDLGLDYYTHYAREVNAIGADQALAAAKRYLVPDRMIVVAVGDRKTIEPELRKLDLGRVEVRDPDGKPLS
jgi:zinc protease